MITERGKVNEVGPVYSQIFWPQNREENSENWQSPRAQEAELWNSEMSCQQSSPGPIYCTWSMTAKTWVLEVIQSTGSGCSGLDSSVCSLLNWAIKVFKINFFDPNQPLLVSLRACMYKPNWIYNNKNTYARGRKIIYNRTQSLEFETQRSQIWNKLLPLEGEFEASNASFLSFKFFRYQVEEKHNSIIRGIKSTNVVNQSRLRSLKA